MKKLIFILLLVVLASCSKSQDKDNFTWSNITYNYDSGPLPPRYHHEYSVFILSNKTCTFSYSFGYQKDVAPAAVEFTVTDDNIIKLDELIKESGLLDGKIESLPEDKQPIGGSLRNVMLVLTKDDPNLDQPSQAIISPYFPVEEYKEKLDNLYKFIYSLVPQDIIDEYEKKKEDFSNKEE